MSEIVKQAKTFVKDLFSAQGNGALGYHNWEHTEFVYSESLALAESAKLPEDEKMILALSALFHDTGFAKSYFDHEANSKLIAREFLEARGFDEARVELVLSTIDATRVPHKQADRLGALLQDADMATLSDDLALVRSEHLRKELAFFENKHFTDAEWIKHNLDFYKEVEYHTEEGKNKYDAGKEKNKDWLKGKNKQNKKADKSSLISSSRTAEMLFKTSLRNHINLTKIADNKANIMLSINAVIITFALPLLYQQLDQATHWYFLIPFFILGGTCVFSMINAALATQPGKSEGKFNPADIQAGKGSLFFFGNFFNTPLTDYSKAMKQSLANPDNMDDSAIIDLYFLGKSVGRKFRLLRRCYSFFLVGITSSAVLFVIMYVIQLFN
ncbi:MAG: DUF5706 domain-containing protein [Saprospiraceae bacterium]|nr:DUF5706 domain-containing protein [Saprospiraceae bacterium]